MGLSMFLTGENTFGTWHWAYFIKICIYEDSWINKLTALWKVLLDNWFLIFLFHELEEKRIFNVQKTALGIRLQGQCYPDRPLCLSGRSLFISSWLVGLERFIKYWGLFIRPYINVSYYGSCIDIIFAKSI